MRAQIFKIAGVKTEKEFYKLFPDEASFMKKHGKAFKKAQAGGFMEKMGGTAGLMTDVGNIAGGISELMQEKKQVDVTEQTKQVAALNVEAQASQAEDIENQYVRPEDIENTGEEFFPIYGVGTNVLAQDGGIFTNKKYSAKFLRDAKAMGHTAKQHAAHTMAQNGFMDWFSKGQTDSVDENGNILTTGMTNAQQAAELGGKVAGAFGIRQNAGGRIGKGIGTAAGKLIPIPGVSAVTGFIGEQFGNVLDPFAKRIKKNQTAIEQSMNQMTGMGVGSKVRQQYNATVQDGGSFSQEGPSLSSELKTHWGGSAEPISYNPFLPDGGETVQFSGNMHNNSNIKGQSGIGVSFNDGQNGYKSLKHGGQINDATLEVEGGEPATKLLDKNGKETVVVYGNLPITKTSAEMIGDPMAAGKKVKNYVKGISKNEETSNKALKKNTKLLTNLNVRTSIDKVKQKGLEAMDIGHTMRLKIAADKKNNAASFQKAITETAEEHGLVANDLARGKFKIDKGIFTPSNTTAQYGGEIPKYQKGGEDPIELTRKEAIAQGYKEGENGVWSKQLTPGTDPVTITIKGESGVKGIAQDRISYKEAWIKAKKQWPEEYGDMDLNEYTEAARQWNIENPNTMVGGRKAIPDTTKTTPGTDPTYGYATIRPGDEKVIEDEDNKKKFGVEDAMAIASGILPYVRPSDQDDFDYRQLYGEMYALSHNKVEPVKAQQFQPRLKVPYDISLQEQRNDITAATRAASKLAGYNPAAQAMIAAQSYDPINKVNAEEFRLNQAMKHEIYGGNIDTMNQAQLTNLGILDQQANRQSIAKSNTKEANQLALNSISDKYAKHSLENKTLGIYENMYNYRFGKDNIAQNMNPFARFNMQGNNNINSMSDDQRMLYYQNQLDQTKATRKARLKAAGQTPGWNPNAQDGLTINKTNLIKALKNY